MDKGLPSASLSKVLLDKMTSEEYFKVEKNNKMGLEMRRNWVKRAGDTAVDVGKRSPEVADSAHGQDWSTCRSRAVVWKGRPGSGFSG